uniref:Heat shock protein n=1 Tax=Mesocestoides corti TaxID=53468 RepID=A0A5K3F7J3_MESCO
MEIVLGITFANKRWSAAYVDDSGSLKMVTTETGCFTIPDVVAFTPRGKLVGQRALEEAAENPKNAIQDTTSLLGKTLDEIKSQDNGEKMPFTMTANERKNTVMLEVALNNEVVRKPVEEVCAYLLRELRTRAEEQTTGAVNEAVIVIPANFNDKQQSSLRWAASLAGFKKVALIKEPEAVVRDFCQEFFKPRQKFDVIFLVRNVSVHSLEECKILACNWEYVVKEHLSTKLLSDSREGANELDKCLTSVLEEKYYIQCTPELIKAFTSARLALESGASSVEINTDTCRMDLTREQIMKLLAENASKYFEPSSKANVLLVGGTFAHPSPGVTFEPYSDLRDVYVVDFAKAGLRGATRDAKGLLGAPVGPQTTKEAKLRTINTQTIESKKHIVTTDHVPKSKEKSRKSRSWACCCGPNFGTTLNSSWSKKKHQ